MLRSTSLYLALCAGLLGSSSARPLIQARQAAPSYCNPTPVPDTQYNIILTDDLTYMWNANRVNYASPFDNITAETLADSAHDNTPNGTLWKFIGIANATSYQILNGENESTQSISILADEGLTLSSQEAGVENDTTYWAVYCNTCNASSGEATGCFIKNDATANCAGFSSLVSLATEVSCDTDNSTFTTFNIALPPTC